MKSIEAKVVVLGSQGVGKTSVVIRYVGSMFSPHVSPTIGASFFTCKLTLNDYRIKLQVWDTAGQERFRSMAPMYYRKANAAMLVYDITSYDSFVEMKSWVEELRRNVDEALVLCVLGNKCDLEQSRAVNTDDAHEYANSIGATFCETSALTSEGIENAFIHTALGLIELSQSSLTTDLPVYESVDGGGGGGSVDRRVQLGQATLNGSPHRPHSFTSVTQPPAAAVTGQEEGGACHC